MKVLHVTSSYWPAFKLGGPIQSVYLLNKFLVKEGLDVTVFTTNAGLKNNKEIILEKENNLNGAKVFYFPSYGYINWNFSPALFLALARNVGKFDLIHITGVWNFPVWAAAFWARFYKKPYIISTRGSLMKEAFSIKRKIIKKIYLNLISKRDLENASAIHFTVKIEKDDYEKLGLKNKKSFIIPNGLDLEINQEDARSHIIPAKAGTQASVIPAKAGTQASVIPAKAGIQLNNNFRKKFNISEDKKIIIFLGRLHKIKGLDTLIPAFSEVAKKEPRAVLVLAGSDDGHKEEIEKEASRFNISDKIIFTGILLGTDKVSALKQSNVFVMPSYSENFGMAAVEAMACKIPVVVTENVGISQEISANEAGLVVKKNVGELSGTILKILQNPKLAEKISRSGYELVKEKFAIDKVAEKFLLEYNELI